MNSGYSTIQKIIHWIMAILIILDLFVAQKFGSTMVLSDRLESRVDHSSIGTLVLLLFLSRVFLRLRYGPPTSSHSLPHWQVLLSETMHMALYIVMLVLIGSGLLTAVNATTAIPLFGVVDITVGNSSEDFFHFVRQFHELATKAMIILVVVHVVAALYHHFLLRDDILIKMFRFRER